MNRKMKKYRYIIFAVAAVAAVSVILSACTSGKESNASSAAPGQSTSAQESAGSSSGDISGSDSNDKNSTLSAKGLRDAVAKAYGENYLPDQAMDAEMIESEFGLTKDMYDEVVAEAPLIGFHPDRLVIVKPKKGKESEVKRALEDALLVMKEQQMQYPVNVAKVNAGKVLEKDGYYCFMILGETDDTSENDNDAAKFAEKQIDIGVKAFDNYFA
ncbi:MAG: DUF4358 domain-containing protein [Ruminiclostridium sp.]|nr:DUF4358 domain-containing protein [Ruminiclostridium sp.]